MLAYAYYINDARIKSYVRTLEAEGHEVDIIALRADGEPAVETRPQGSVLRIMSKYQGESTVMYAWSYLRFLCKAALLVARRSLRRRYDVIHVHNMPNALVFSAIVGKLLGSRVILDVHDLMPANYMAKFGAGEDDLPVRILKIEQRLSALFADHVFCADHNQQDYLAEHCRIPRHKISVQMNLPNEEMFRPVAADKDGSVFRIVYHGTVAHRLGIDLIVKAMARVVERIPAELWIYGAGDYLPEAVALASHLGLEEKVHFSRTFFPVEKIPEIVAGMDLGIIGNRRNLACDRYMLPVKLLEYVYLGIPVIAPRLDVIGRYFDGTMVRFYEPENIEQMAAAIEELYRDGGQQERLARNAAAFYQKHNIRAQAERYLDLLSAPGVSLQPRPAQPRV
jgi:glycosyltransferase involved in cell wall biosynthesis